MQRNLIDSLKMIKFTKSLKFQMSFQFNKQKTWINFGSGKSSNSTKKK